ncbi:hypothetical protein C1646_767782 [Rhizophagus diaphanus]|nr:hypothetical protein C1646_767782 [Rhizophagus diaphanus] [Rhizophagus sp. MUCL 43196]
MRLRSSTLASALDSNPIPTMNNETQQENSNEAHALYSGTLGAFLESNEYNNHVNDPRTLDNNETLQRAADWLAENNPYLHPFMNLLSSDNSLHTLNDPFPKDHHHWPSWSYLQLEKLRHHQNTQ